VPSRKENIQKSNLCPVIVHPSQKEQKQSSDASQIPRGTHSAAAILARSANRTVEYNGIFRKPKQAKLGAKRRSKHSLRHLPQKNIERGFPRARHIAKPILLVYANNVHSPSFRHQSNIATRCPSYENISAELQPFISDKS